MAALFNIIRFAVILRTMSPEELSSQLAELSKHRLDDENIQLNPWLATFLFVLTTRYSEMRSRLKIEDDFLGDVQFALGLDRLRDELTAKVFLHGAPTLNHLESIIDLLLHVSWRRHCMVNHKKLTA